MNTEQLLTNDLLCDVISDHISNHMGNVLSRCTIVFKNKHCLDI